ncbi:MAG: efflux RND transporter periplasmic adaptor subunit [Planctomycetota bacterium]
MAIGNGWATATVRAAGAMAAFVGVLVGPAAFGQGPPPANVVVDLATEQEMTPRRAVTGEIRSKFRSVLASQAAGLVLEIGVREGELVERGRVLARLDSEIASLEVERLEAEVAAAEGETREAEAQLDRAARDLERIEELDRRGSSSAAQLDEFRTEVATREALLSQARGRESAARASLSRARRELRDHEIKAPFDGRVVARMTESGEWVDVGDSIVELVSVSEMEVWVDVPERLVGALVIDTERVIPLDVPALPVERTPGATLASLVPVGDALSRLFPARLALGDPAGLLPGMSVTAYLPAGESAVMLTVHKDAVLRDDAGEFVFVAMPMGGAGDSGGPSEQAVPMRINRLYAEGDRVVIRAGAVRAGMRVVVEGNERVYPTQPLVVASVRDAAGDVAGGVPGDVRGGVE